VTLVGYLSHPIGDVLDDPVQRHDNLRNAGEWLEFLVERTDVAILCPWLAYITQMGKMVDGPRAMVDQLTLVARSDILFQVGGRINPHMVYEQRTAERENMPIVDLTHFGDRPPWEEGRRAGIAIFIRTERSRIATLKPRRVWVPPLSADDIASLRLAQQKLLRDKTVQDAADIIQKIVQAALKP